MLRMKQSSLGLGNTNKRTRKREFLEEMERVVPWQALVELVAPYAPEGRRGRPPFSVEAMLRIHFMQQWFTLSDPAMEEALHDVALFRDFAGLGGWSERLPDESTILRFRHLLEQHKLAPQILQTVNELLHTKGLMLRAGTVVDATLIAAPSSTKNNSGQRNPEMHQSKKGKQWYFGMKAHIGVDAESGLVHTVRGTAGNVNDVVQANALLHGQESDAFGDAGYQGADKRDDAKPGAGQEQAAGSVAGPARTPEGQHPRQGRASVSRAQAPVRAREGALPGAEQEQRATAHAVRAVESVDGAQGVADTGWASPSADGRCGVKRGEK
jgi:transposase, IS5 family